MWRCCKQGVNAKWGKHPAENILLVNAVMVNLKLQTLNAFCFWPFPGLLTKPWRKDVHFFTTITSALEVFTAFIEQSCETKASPSPLKQLCSLKSK